MVQWTLMLYHNIIGRRFEARKPKPQKLRELKTHIFGLLPMSSFPHINTFLFISYPEFSYSRFFSSNFYIDIGLYCIRKLQLDPSNRNICLYAQLPLSWELQQYILYASEIIEKFNHTLFHWVSILGFKWIHFITI